MLVGWGLDEKGGAEVPSSPLLKVQKFPIRSPTRSEIPL